MPFTLLFERAANTLQLRAACGATFRVLGSQYKIFLIRFGPIQLIWPQLNYAKFDSLSVIN